jgi:hypothetical protein
MSPNWKDSMPDFVAEYTPPGLHVTGLDWDQPGGEQITVHAREVVDPPRRNAGLSAARRRRGTSMTSSTVPLYRADRVFRLSFLEHAGNPVLTGIVSDLRPRTRQLGLTPLLESGIPGRAIVRHSRLRAGRDL